MAEAKGLKLRIGPLPGAIHSDSGLVRSVIQNLLVNAVRYTAKGGVLIGVRRRGDDWRIDVVDSGVGIPEAQIGTIFGEFTRLGAVDVEGQGLGLALVARIARLLGGTVEVRSVPGRGSRFSLRLPAHAAPAPVAAAAAPQASSGRSLRLLVVDDDPGIVEASVTLLRQLGHVPVAAPDSATALGAPGPFDAVIADLRLGEDSLDGLALIAALREMRPGLPAALVTAENGPALAAQAAAANISLYAKPIDPEALRRFLDRVSVAQVQP